MSELVLSLFPGIGLLDMAFEELGFCVVRGPDLLWGGDVKRFHPPAGRFDGVIGGPPCQAFSSLRFMVIQRYGREKLAPNLIPEFERCIAEAAPRWFLMENVPLAPAPIVEGYAVSQFMLNNRWVGAVQNRSRRLSFGVQGGVLVNLVRYLDIALFESMDSSPAVTSGARAVPVKIGGNGKTKRTHKTLNGPPRSVAEMCELQGLPADHLKHAPFTSMEKRRVVGNGVPLPLGRAVAQAVRRWLDTAP